MSETQREMTLEEYVGRLASSHRARKELGELQVENARLRTTLEQLADDKGAAYWTAKEVQDIARQALKADGEGKCTCADNQGGPCASCMETKHNL